MLQSLFRSQQKLLHAMEHEAPIQPSQGPLKAEPQAADELYQHHIPEWETTRQPKEKRRSHRAIDSTNVPDFLNRALPPSRRYCGLHRRSLLILLLGAALAIIALGVGLGIGLRKRRYVYSNCVGHKCSSCIDQERRHQNLPLPSSTKTFTGDLTYYTPGLGACGVTSTSSSNIVSISHILFDSQSSSSNPNDNPLCGRKIRARRDGKSVDLTVVDRCTGCAVRDLDVSPGVFKKLASIDEGRVSVEWAWLD